MKVLLRHDVKGVGRRGDIVDVAGGYARNFLLPGGMGMLATDGMEAQAAAMRRGRDLREARDHEAAVTKAGVLSGVVLRIEARAGAQGKLFGSIGASEIVDAVRGQKGVELNRHDVHIGEPIKAVGNHEVTIGLFADVTAVVTVEIVPLPV